MSCKRAVIFTLALAALSMSSPAAAVCGIPISCGAGCICGSTCDDLLFGDANNNCIKANSGNDVVYGLAGDDYLEGGPGNDVLDGGSGNDICYDNGVFYAC